MVAKSKGIIIVKKIIVGISISLGAFLLLIVVWICVDKFINKSKVPSFIGYSSLIVATGSMSGTIEEGDFIIIKDTGDYKIGDIITFIHPGEKIPTTHRIIQINQDGSYVTKGDANNSQDIKVVTNNEIFGEVISIWHGFGIFVGWFTSGGGFIYILGLMLIICLLMYFLKKTKPELQTDKKEYCNERIKIEDKKNKDKRM